MMKMKTVLCLLESKLSSRVSPGEVLLCLRVRRVPMPMMVLARARNQLKHCFDELRPLAAWFSLISMGIERWYTDVLFLALCYAVPLQRHRPQISNLSFTHPWRGAGCLPPSFSSVRPGCTFLASEPELSGLPGAATKL